MKKSIIALCSFLFLFGAGCQQGIDTVRNLDESGRGLAAIPSDVFSHRELERLNLSNNKLTGAPPSQIQNLQLLQELDLSNNELTGIPAEIGQLKHLQVLNLAHNKLTGLPHEMANLTQLKVLDLTGNNISTQDLDVISRGLQATEIRK